MSCTSRPLTTLDASDFSGAAQVETLFSGFFEESGAETRLLD